MKKLASLTIGHYPFTRREFIKSAALSAALPTVAAWPEITLAANPTGEKLHGLSSFGDLKYGPNYRHFDYATPEAPKGGEFAFQPSYWYFNQNTQTFNTLNSFVLKGEAPPRMEHCFDTLMVWAVDEPDTLYCALAESVEISPDRNRYRFTLRPEARFHDGSWTTAEDVAFSYMTIKEKGHPQLAVDLADLDEAAAISRHVVELRFNGEQSDRAILAVANSVPILSAAFYENLPFEEHVMERPLGSGPYRVGDFNPGISIAYDRVEDYWGKDLPFAHGLDHFDKLRIDFFRERQAAFEAFKKGVVRWREEFTSKVWATEYNFPAVAEDRVVKAEFPGEQRPSLQAWAANTRREKFANPRTREAIATVFDFDWTNRNIFYGAYIRSQSLFEQSEFAAAGMPSSAELALLEPWRDQLPETVFGQAPMQFQNDGSGRDRAAFRRARDLLEEAGWRREGGVYVNDAGEELAIEFLIRAQVFERVLGPFLANLKAIGIPATIRLVDPSQFQARIESFDFDMVGLAFSFGATPTEESLRHFFHSDSATRQGSNNYPGITHPAVDAMVAEIGKVKSRRELVTVMRALDRVLRAYQFWIPNWYSPNHRVAMWDMFGWAEPKPDYFWPVERLWWVDKEKHAAMEQKG